jgi:NADH-quinone oxidoreductase subunit J
MESTALQGKKTYRRKRKMNPELAIFFAVSFVTLASAVLVISAREIFHSALYLAVMLLSIAGLFVMLGAEFIAAVQILVYAGAVVILVIFAIMLTKKEQITEDG